MSYNCGDLKCLAQMFMNKTWEGWGWYKLSNRRRRYFEEGRGEESVYFDALHHNNGYIICLTHTNIVYSISFKRYIYFRATETLIPQILYSRYTYYRSQWPIVK